MFFYADFGCSLFGWFLAVCFEILTQNRPKKKPHLIGTEPSAASWCIDTQTLQWSDLRTDLFGASSAEKCDSSVDMILYDEMCVAGNIFLLYSVLYL